VLAGDEGDGPAGQVKAPGQEIEDGLVRGAFHRRRAHSHLEGSLADGTQAGARGPGLGADRELDGAGDLPDDVVRYGVPAFFGARNDTLSSTRTGASAS